MRAIEILKEMADNFETKINSDFKLSVKFEFRDENEDIYLLIDNKKIYFKKTVSKEIEGVFKTTGDVLKKIYDGKITAFTAAGKAHVSDDAPLDWKFKDGYVPENMEDFYYFIMHFFNTSEPEKIVLGEKYARKIHGGNAIPLYYYPGLRTAWYMVKKGEQMNEEGETDPFHQAVIIIKGSGYAKIGDKKIEVKKNESYYIPPKSDQVIWNENDEPLVLIWLAWGEKA